MFEVRERLQADNIVFFINSARLDFIPILRLYDVRPVSFYRLGWTDLYALLTSPK